MKYINKCPVCSRTATKKIDSRWYCEECARRHRREFRKTAPHSVSSLRDVQLSGPARACFRNISEYERNFYEKIG